MDTNEEESTYEDAPSNLIDFYEEQTGKAN